jgi:hypothetical protein
MTKMTIATDQLGNILGAIQYSDEKSRDDDMQVSVSFAPGSRLHEVEVGPELDMRKVSDVSKFQEALSRHARSAK